MWKKVLYRKYNLEHALHWGIRIFSEYDSRWGSYWGITDAGMSRHRKSYLSIAPHWYENFEQFWTILSQLFQNVKIWHVKALKVSRCCLAVVFLETTHQNMLLLREFLERVNELNSPPFNQVLNPGKNGLHIIWKVLILI